MCNNFKQANDWLTMVTKAHSEEVDDYIGSKKQVAAWGCVYGTLLYLYGMTKLLALVSEIGTEEKRSYCVFIEEEHTPKTPEETHEEHLFRTFKAITSKLGNKFVTGKLTLAKFTDDESEDFVLLVEPLFKHPKSTWRLS